MKDINIRNIKPLAEPQRADKPAPKAPSGNEDFKKVFDSAMHQMQEATAGSHMPAEKVDAISIKKQVSAANENYAKVMKAGQSLSELFHHLNAQKNDK